MSNRLGLCGVALLVSLTLAGCGGEESPKSNPKPTSSPSPTAPPGLDTSGPKRPTKQANTPESALEYGRYFALLVQYAIETRDSRVLNEEAFDQAGCANCRAVTDLINELRTTGYWQRSEPVELGKFRVGAIDGGFRVNGTFVYPETESVDLSGEVEQTTPPGTYNYVAALRWDGDKGAWRVLDFVYENKA